MQAHQSGASKDNISMPHHHEKHYIHRLGWLRAAVLGANDGIISVTSLVVGLLATGVEVKILLITCLAGWIAGAVSMAAGEYVSVKSQQDIESSDLRIEQRELHRNPEAELMELTQIYIQRGLEPTLAHQVAIQLTAHDALIAHARDEIGISAQTAARPILAALSSALAFSMGAMLPLLAILVIPATQLQHGMIMVGIVSLLLLGMIASFLAGTSMLKGALRITFWGVAAMALTSWVGTFFKVSL
jgi:VIT1/CCC1 family predicted Fe2+/Mn2+ transporter